MRYCETQVQNVQNNANPEIDHFGQIMSKGNFQGDT